METLLAWQHLVNSELIEGTYLGISLLNSSTDKNHHAGVNCPATKLNQEACWGILQSADYSGHGEFFVPYGKHVLMLGTTNNAGGGGAGMPHFPNSPIITPQEMLSLDTKIDDGKPSTGSINSLSDLPAGSNSSMDCHTLVAGTPEYKGEEDNVIGCQFVIKAPF